MMLLLLACKPATEAVVVPERPELPPPLEIPDVTGVDFEARYLDGLNLALSVNATVLFSSHAQAIDTFEPGCPDIYFGIPPEDVADIDRNMVESGFTWADHCAQDHGGNTFSGYGYWDGTAQVEGEAGTAEGVTHTGAREMIADGVWKLDDNVLFEFDGEASDAMTTVVAEGYERWTYTSLVDGTSTGSLPFPDGSLSPQGWRTDLYVATTGGAEERIELRGNVYLFDGRIGDRFDSVAVDLDLIGELGAGPDDCLEEPLGWIGLRDENAVWYDLVFLPRYAFDITGQPYPNDPLQECDGCGTLYIRGVEQGEICPDLSSLQANLSPPSLQNYVTSIRELPQEEHP